MQQSNKKHQKIAQILSNFEALIAVMPGHVYWKDRNGIYLGSNKAQADHVKAKYNKEFVGKTTFDLLPKEVAEKVVQDDLYVMSTGKELSVEEMTPDGRVMLSKKIPLKDEAGEVVGLLGVSFDITEQKNQEKKLVVAKRQAELRWEEIIANMPGHIFWQDLNGKFLGCNNDLLKSLGYKKEQFIGKTLFDIQPYEEALKVYEINQKVIETAEAITVTEQGVAEGKPAYFLSKKAPMKDEQGNVIGILGIAFNITAEKEAEELREEKRVIEESLKNAKLMAAGIAHELRTPLATINSLAGNLEHYMADVFKGYEAACAEEKVEKLDEEVLQYLKDAPKSLSKVTYGANTFINMMLMKVNLENVKRYELRKLSIVACVNEAIEVYPMEEEDKALLKVNLGNDFEFMGDKTLFVHIIFNLMKNALYYIKAARKGEISIWLEPGEELNILHFKDTGRGIAPEVLANLFGAFYSKTRHGTGVGLALCKLIMEEFRGSIACDSIEGEYTHFKMMFPKIPQ
ncbi:MAG: Sensory box histidine kinase/response regulator [Gammaproteobacteria bacterium]|jgi:PAS domain S-box-containing protein|nr:Sensory box histidine kinase/response regulator [Gammaproteobacteria bacterium]